MIDKDKILQEFFAILTAGGRNNGEQSRALPQSAYGNPADQVRFEREKRIKRCKSKKRRK